MKAGKKYIIYAILVLLPVLYALYLVLFVHFDPSKLKSESGVLVSRPKYISLKAGYEWQFRLKRNPKNYRINYLNPAQITKDLISKMHKGDTIVIYTYSGLNFGDLGNYSNGTIEVLGIVWKDKKQLYPHAISDHLFERNMTFFCFSFLVLSLCYYYWFFKKAKT